MKCTQMLTHNGNMCCSSVTHSKTIQAASKLHTCARQLLILVVVPSGKVA